MNSSYTFRHDVKPFNVLGYPVEKLTVIEFPIDPMQNKIDAAITTYVFVIVLRVFPMHNFTKMNIKLFSV